MDTQTHTKTQRHRDTEAQRHRDTETQRHRDTQTESHRHTDTHLLQPHGQVVPSRCHFRVVVVVVDVAAPDASRVSHVSRSMHIRRMGARAVGSGVANQCTFPLYLPSPSPGGWLRAAGVGSLLLVHVVIGVVRLFAPLLPQRVFAAVPLVPPLRVFAGYSAREDKARALPLFWGGRGGGFLLALGLELEVAPHRVRLERLGRHRMLLAVGGGARAAGELAVCISRGCFIPGSRVQDGGF